MNEETFTRLERLRALLRHQIPDGDPAAVVDRALTLLLQHVERTKLATTARTRHPRVSPSSSRHIPAAVRRAVWARDEGRCAFVNGDRRCGETGFVEYHHVIPFGAGGPSTDENLQLRCRAHNAYEASREFGDWELRPAAPSGRS